MDGSTDYTSPVNDNLLGLTTNEAINEKEAEEFLRAELAILSLDETAELSVTLVLTLHRIAFECLYDWAGKWRRVDVTVG